MLSFPEIEMVISGGQTGADQAGLAAASHYGIKTGGYAPKNFMTTDGPDYSLKNYGLVEFDGGYKERTIENVKSSDMTIIIASNIYSPGTILATKQCKKFDKPYVIVPYDPLCKLEDWIYQSDLKKCLDIIQIQNKPVIINIAGNSAITCEQSYTKAFFFCSALFEILKLKNATI
jgi:hypothetical protein